MSELESINAYTSEAFDGFDDEDVRNFSRFLGQLDIPYRLVERFDDDYKWELLGDGHQ